jgi:hypothetical protein
VLNLSYAKHSNSGDTAMDAIKKANRNNVYLSRFHIGLSVLYLFVILILRSMAGDFGDLLHMDFKYLLMFYSSSTLLLLHLALAFGAAKKWELSRKISVGVGVLLFIAVPIGTIIAVFFLPLTDWGTSPEQTDAA